MTEEDLKQAIFVTVNMESATGEDLGKVSYIPLPNVDYIPKQERMYSEEEVKQIIDKTLIEYSDFVLADIPHWFEQFKKKIT